MLLFLSLKSTKGIKSVDINSDLPNDIDLCIEKATSSDFNLLAHLNNEYPLAFWLRTWSFKFEDKLPGKVNKLQKLFLKF